MQIIIAVNKKNYTHVLKILLLHFQIVYIFKILTKPHPVICRHESEKFFVNPGIENKCMPFPRLCDPPSVDLSVIIPAYDEEHRCKC